MKGLSLFVFLLVLTISSAPSFAQEYEVERDSDGPFAFKILSVVLNEGSSLQRESIRLNISSSPVSIKSNTLEFDYEDRRFRYNMATSLEIRSEVAAIEIRYLLFDVFGKHMKNLQNLEVRDLSVGPVSMDGTWNALRENDLAEHLTTVTYVAKVRLSDGRIWIADFDQVRSILGTLELERTIEEDAGD